MTNITIESINMTTKLPKILLTDWTICKYEVASRQSVIGVSDQVFFFNQAVQPQKKRKAGYIGFIK